MSLFGIEDTLKYARVASTLHLWIMHIVLRVNVGFDEVLVFISTKVDLLCSYPPTNPIYFDLYISLW